MPLQAKANPCRPPGCCRRKEATEVRHWRVRKPQLQARVNRKVQRQAQALRKATEDRYRSILLLPLETEAPLKGPTLPTEHQVTEEKPPVR